jgi:hypothetical protein
MRRDRLIRYSPSLARDVSTPAYIVPGTAGADKERATWSRVMTDFLDELGQVVDALFEFRSKFTANEVKYIIALKPADVTIGIGDFASQLKSDSIFSIEETMLKQGFSVNVVSMEKVVDEAIAHELPQRLRQSPLLLMQSIGGSARELRVAEFAVEATEVSNVMVPVIFLSRDEQAIASAGVSILRP